MKADECVRFARVRSLALLAVLLAISGRLAAQVSDQHEDANSFRTDASFGTPNIYTPTPHANIFATTPGPPLQDLWPVAVRQ